MSLLKININHRNYSDWCIFSADTLLPLDKISISLSVDVEFEPIQHKLFSGDVFTFENDIATIHNSPVRNMQDIPAVLILTDNKTYGRTKVTKGKLLYKCVPDDIRLPIFLVPYEIKHVGFSKVFSNLYVTINFSDWSGNTLPFATLTQTIGPIDILENFYEYQLYCKSLNTSMQKFNNATKMLVKEDHEAFIHNIFLKHPLIEDRTSSYTVFSIDPSNCSDFDDAFSIKIQDDNTVLLSIYIANVTIIMDALNLWSSVSKRIATIYLPDKKRPMLPTILSDCLCSLQKGSSRFAFVLDIIIDQTNNEIISTKYSNCLIRVHKNYVYEEPDLLKNSSYILLLDTTRLLSQKYKYINHISGSHDVVAYLMILMNYFSAKELLKNKVGIFRSTVVNAKQQPILPDNVPEDVVKFVKIWNSSFGQYVVLNGDLGLNLGLDLLNHSLLNMDAYIHITSPIRRIVDLLNLVKFQEVFQLSTHLSQNASDFYTHWTDKIDYINVTMRAIKKIQNDCCLLNTFSIDCVLDKLYDGYCFDKIARSDGLFQYIVFLPELKLTSKITIREDLNNYQLKQYKLFLFNNEERFKKKIRLQLCN
jgi:exoribonuclease R